MPRGVWGGGGGPVSVMKRNSSTAVGCLKATCGNTLGETKVSMGNSRKHNGVSPNHPYVIPDGGPLALLSISSSIPGGFKNTCSQFQNSSLRCRCSPLSSPPPVRTSRAFAPCAGSCGDRQTKRNPGK